MKRTSLPYLMTSGGRTFDGPGRLPGSGSRGEGEEGGGMSLHMFDGDRWYPCADLDQAKALMAECIGIARDLCDPEWPDYVERIATYEAPDGCGNPDEDGTPVLVTRMVNVRDAEPGDAVDFWCDYEVMEVST